MKAPTLAAVAAASALWMAHAQQPQQRPHAELPRRKRRLQRHQDRTVRRDLGLFDAPHHERSPRRPPPGHSGFDGGFGTVDGGQVDATSRDAAAAASTAASTTGVCRSIIAIERLRVPSAADVDSGHFAANGRIEGIPNDEDNEDGSDEEEDDDGEFVCELSDRRTVPIRSTRAQRRELWRAMEEGRLVSGVSTVAVESKWGLAPPGGAAEGTVEEGTEAEGVEEGAAPIAGMKPSPPAATDAMDSPEGTGFGSFDALDGVALPPGDVQFQTSHRTLQHHSQRSLANYSGAKPSLVILVTDVDGKKVPASAKVVSDKFFGTDGDVENMKSQFASCSFGNFNVVYDQYGSRTDQIVSKLSAPGVLEVTIPISLQNSQELIRHHVLKAATAKLGSALPNGFPGPFAHVLVVIEKCYVGCGWAAYAYVNSYLSVYQGGYYAMPAVQMHEVGHNLNLAHSGGMDGRTYTDHTCLMGNPLFSDDVGDMCFNPAKTYQIVTGPGSSGGNWYGKERVETWDPNAEGRMWTGKLVGVAEYGRLPDPTSFRDAHAASKVVLKIESGTANDLYVGFNRAVGINADNREADDMVTVIQAGGNGRSYSTSALKAKLGRDGVYTHRRFRNGMDLRVTVDEINTGEAPGYAVVTVQLGETPGPTRQPSNRPSNRPTSEPSKRPTNQPSKLPSKLPTSEPSKRPTSEPSRRPTKMPSPGPTLRPTSDPTREPTRAPTSNPTNLPTSSPTGNPTKMPTDQPSSQPTSQPTDRPTAHPTNPTDGGSAGGSATETIDFSTTMSDAQSRVANGTMFTVEAISEDVTITSISTYTQSIAIAPMQVYYRAGMYQDYTAGDEGWTLLFDRAVHQKGTSELTRLGSFIDDQVMSVPAGQSVSIYVYTPLKLTYQYKSEWSEGQPVKDDGNLRLLAGIALAYGKWEEGCEVSPQADGQCVFGPRVFSGVLEYTLGASGASGGATTGTGTTTTSTAVTTTTTSTAGSTTTEVPPAPPAPIVEFMTPNRNSASLAAKGLMFTIEAKQNIAIRGLDYIAKRTATSGYNVYYRYGGYNGLALSSDGWNLAHRGSSIGRSGEVVDVGDFAEEIPLAKGDTLSFYVFARKGQMFTPGNIEGRAYGDDDSIIVNEGLVTKSLFRREVGTGKWAGIIRYSTD